MRMAFEVRHFFCENDASPLKKPWERGGRAVPDEPYRIWKKEGGEMREMATGQYHTARINMDRSRDLSSCGTVPFPQPPSVHAGM